MEPLYNDYLHVYQSHNVTKEEYEQYIENINTLLANCSAKEYNLYIDFDISWYIQIKLDAEAKEYNLYIDFDISWYIQIKLDAEKAPSTVLESTMTPKQLYDIDNISWAKGLSIKEIKENMGKWGTKFYPHMDDLLS